MYAALRSRLAYEYFYGFANIAGKPSSKHKISNPWLPNFVLGSVITLCIIPIAIANGIVWSSWDALWVCRFIFNVRIPGLSLADAEEVKHYLMNAIKNNPSKDTHSGL